MIEIRRAEPTDTRDVARLWEGAFPGRRTMEDRVRMLETGGRYGGLETVRVARGEDGALAGAFKAYRLEGHIAGSAMPMMGLAAVAVASPYRRRGIGARLCEEAIRMAAERGDAISALYPFRPDYYERLGWGLVGRLYEHRFRTELLEPYEEAGAVREARLGTDAAAIADCYQRVARRSNGPIARDRQVWSYRLTGAELGVLPVDGDPIRTAAADPRRRVIVYDDGGVTGYALLRHPPVPERADRRIDVRELVAETETAYRGLLGYLARQSADWPLARHFARPEERFGDRLRDPRPPGHRPARSLYYPIAQIVRGPMLRIVDMPRALQLRRWFDAGGQPPEEAVIRISIEDRQRPENAGPWLLAPLAPGDDRVRGAGSGDAGIATDASTFARVFAGEISPGDAARLGRATVEGDVALMDRAFATRESFWLPDEF